ALVLLLEKLELAASGHYKLSAERYRENATRSSIFPIVPLGEVAEVVPGQSPPGESYNDVAIGTPFYQGKTEFGEAFIGRQTQWTTNRQRFAQDGEITMAVA